MTCYYSLEVFRMISASSAFCDLKMMCFIMSLKIYFTGYSVNLYSLELHTFYFWEKLQHSSFDKLLSDIFCFLSLQFLVVIYTTSEPFLYFPEIFLNLHLFDCAFYRLGNFLNFLFQLSFWKFVLSFIFLIPKSCSLCSYSPPFIASFSCCGNEIFSLNTLRIIIIMYLKFSSASCIVSVFLNLLFTVCMF